MAANSLVLQHSGVKGMKWGVRKGKSERVTLPKGKGILGNPVARGRARMQAVGGGYLSSVGAMVAAGKYSAGTRILGMFGGMALSRLGVHPDVARAVTRAMNLAADVHMVSATVEIGSASIANAYENRKKR